MFGGLSFMVDDRMIVNLRGDGNLLVRVDPERANELLQTEGAQPAEMGAGRAMGNGWISVAKEAIEADENFDFWIGVALAYCDNKGKIDRRHRSRKQRSGH